MNSKSPKDMPGKFDGLKSAMDQDNDRYIGDHQNQQMVCLLPLFLNDGDTYCEVIFSKSCDNKMMTLRRYPKQLGHLGKWVKVSALN
jgi:hypothetical protein